jgi:MFS family permease
MDMLQRELIGAPSAHDQEAMLHQSASGELLTVRQQLLIAVFWFSLSFQGGALLGIAIPSQVLDVGTGATKTTTLALLGGFAGLITTITQPITGVLSDLSAGRWGRRRPYLVSGVILDIIGLAIMARAANLAMLFAGFLPAALGSAVSGAAYQAYIPDHVPTRQYGEASGYLGAMTMLGTIAGFAVAGIVVEPRHVGTFYLITIAVMAVGAACTAIGIPDPPIQADRRAVLRSWRALWLEPWRRADFTWVFVTRSMMMLALYVLFTFVAYYVRDVVHITDFTKGAAVVAGVATLAALASGVVAGILSDRTGRKGMVSAAGVMMAGALLVLAFFHAVTVVLGVGVVFGLAFGTYSAVDWALAVDVLPDMRFAAKDLGLWGVSTNLPQALAPFIGGLILAILAPFGPSVSYGALFFLAAVCAALSGILVQRIRGVR